MVTWVTVTKRTALVGVARAIVAGVVVTTVEMQALVAMEGRQTGAVVVSVVHHEAGRVVSAGQETGVEDITERTWETNTS